MQEDRQLHSRSHYHRRSGHTGYGLSENQGRGYYPHVCQVHSITVMSTVYAAYLKFILGHL